MKRLLFGALFLSTALLLTACPQTPPPPVNPAECPVGPLRVQSLDAPSKLHGLGSFKGEFVPGELIVVPKPGLSLQSLRASGVEPQAQLALDVIKVKVPHGEEKVRAEALCGRVLSMSSPTTFTGLCGLRMTSITPIKAPT